MNLEEIKEAKKKIQVHAQSGELKEALDIQRQITWKFARYIANSKQVHGYAVQLAEAIVDLDNISTSP